MKEKWTNIQGFEGYQVSDLGRIRTDKAVMNHRLNTAGYCCINLCIRGKKSTHMVHRLVATAFIPNPEAKRTVNHKNGNKTDNRIENLEWATHGENHKHAYQKGLKKPFAAKGENAASKLTESNVLQIRQMLSDGVYQKEIAKLFGVSQNQISRVKRGVNWTHI